MPQHIQSFQSDLQKDFQWVGKTQLSQQQSFLPGEYCTANTDKCNPCGGKRPKPEEPDGSYDTMGAVTAIAKGGPLDIWLDWRLL